MWRNDTRNLDKIDYDRRKTHCHIQFIMFNNARIIMRIYIQFHGHVEPTSNKRKKLFMLISFRNVVLLNHIKIMNGIMIDIYDICVRYCFIPAMGTFDLLGSITRSNKNIYYTSHFMDYLISFEISAVVLNEFAFMRRRFSGIRNYCRKHEEV